ncbi:hypothetical protein CYMTET_36323, partial [Cymbomonas tetramitiformis]
MDESLAQIPLPDFAAETPTDAAKKLNQHGFVLLKGLVTVLRCEQIRQLVDLARTRAAPRDYTAIHRPQSRKDLPLSLHPFSSIIADLLECQDSLLGKLIQRIAGEEARLVEFASMTILPGAAAQPVHQDVHMASADQDANARYLTVFVSLCDVPSERGPMEIWCGTQNMYIPWKGTEAADISDCSACSEQSDEDNGPVVAEDYEVEHEDELTLK